MTVRTVSDSDWPAISLVSSTSFGAFSHPDTLTAWRTMMPNDSAVVVCDGADVVGVSLYLDFQLTAPGGTLLPAAGVSMVAVAPTHRRRGLMRMMLTELHRRIAAARYPIAVLTASDGGIYGRFGYGPATIRNELSVERGAVRFHADAPDPGGVRLVRPADHRDEFAAIYDRWRRNTPGGLLCPQPLWDELLADRDNTRGGGTAWFAMLHPDGYALYRVFGRDPMTVRVGEFAAVTVDAHVALWRALLGLDLIDKVVMDTHHADPLPYLLSDARLAATTARQDDLWLRIMDIPTALVARRYQAELHTVLEVSDTFGGGGRFALQIRDGRARCTPTDEPAQIEMALDVLGSLYLGAHRASELAQANRIHSHDIALVQHVDAAFASAVPARLGYRF
ncbi:enhanced intracellular survival protein Eis [Mycobacterium haemophilum]|uniref:enhanced intracellular survival protein Eis n=1 Tax=Mycobacterium haemophilum TaxID=29311 RepID=UPI001E2D7C34|nr:enhanced intracellular survival protein Eis [Mycobacterium haemophilum]